jgi:pyridoxine 5-phosphate synthase
MRLGVNIDHIATLRQARLEDLPDPVLAAEAAIKGGADGIVCHLREDRRHIQDRDVYLLRELDTRLDLEMAATQDMLKFALKVKPDMVTIVPEKRQEVTTEGGLDVKKYKKILQKIIPPLKRAKIIVSLFVDPIKYQIEESKNVLADYIEIHTGSYANAENPKKKKKELLRIKESANFAKSIGLKVNAGHGLDYDNTREIGKIKEIEELNIGFSIIAHAIFVGIKEATFKMKKLIRRK